ncbi:hypothetical protein KHA90_16755 [Flavobacterium psychroterrae]|uniref:Lipoprotein n=1 Tax=Flavobacterium psychroterrae TaxID=2133767 RepID=A0ABS5PFI3_9FLAO|nr:hypothetical protein [Flavobacterium psychroterrae]MBS7232670.1 hypothetical protein [Flavobacterium psychroterrae]
MKYFSLLFIILLFSCGNKEAVLLPKSNISIVKDVQDHSPIYIFFKMEGKDTIAEVNRKNSIISTNWIFNIDKRLPLKLVIPEIMKLQEKKRAEKAHKNEMAENYYSYADSIGKNMAFLPFTKVYYEIGKPTNGDLVIYFRRGSDIVLVNNEQVKKEDVLMHIGRIAFFVKPKVYLLFDKNMSYQEYIETKIQFQKLNSYNDEIPKEFIL